MRIYVEAYGCWLAKADARILAQRLGGAVVESPEGADLVLIYTCAVREDGEVRQLKRIRELSARGGRLVVAGCLARARPYTIKSAAPQAALLSPQEVEGGRERTMEALPEHDGSPIYVAPLQVGCLGNCTFCITKYTRGGAGYVKSARPDLVVEAVKRAVERGAREIYLTGQDVATYGYDAGWRDGWTLPDLLEKILSRVEGDYRIRVGMSEPWVFGKFVDRLLDIVKNDERVYRYFHLPVQSGSDRVLKAMGRKYTVDEYKELVSRIKRALNDDVFIATDVIVGFPGEGEEDFEATLRLMEELQFDKVHVARYSRRPFTEAAIMPGQVPDAVKKERSRKASELALRLALQRNSRLIGRRIKVLVDEVDHGLLVGRAHDYRQVVVGRSEGRARLGYFVEVEIKRAEPVYLWALDG
ncbi:MAG: tRNA (N(6)-L-threonylcarbamoyladenosine(37)-C(2))-methylthiotransferase [Thermoproteus sp.]|nr:tRNA (N(6)-L-threonylcarbamoyladenosine(37)-C(2))-methylthiotransferase [Thermoproteus sp.]